MADQSLMKEYMEPAGLSRIKSIAKSAMLGLTIFALGAVTFLSVSRNWQSEPTKNADANIASSTDEQPDQTSATAVAEDESTSEENDKRVEEGAVDSAEGEEILDEADNPNATARVEYEGVQVMVGQVIRLNKVFFDMDRATLSDQSIPELSGLITFLRDNPNVSIEIGGHTNKTKSVDYSNNLSLQRAEAVFEYLANGGIESARLRAKGYGYSIPVAADSGTSAALNRRVEFKVTRI